MPPCIHYPARNRVFFVAFACLAGSCAGSQAFALKERKPTSAESTLAVPGSVVRRLGLEQQTTIADLGFLKVVQYLGTTSSLSSGYPELLRYSDWVTDVDPLFGYAYEVAGVALTDPARRYEESSQILEKGIANVPNRWQLPFFAAFNRWYGQGDYAGAAPLLLRASQLPGSPFYLADLAARLYSEAGEIEGGLALIDGTLTQRLPEAVRENLQSRRRDLLVEGVLRKIDQAAAQFASYSGRRPVDLAELLKFAPALTLPEFPVAYDHAAGQAVSPLLKARIRLHHADAKPAPLSLEGK